jgi:hypothetical protein
MMVNIISAVAVVAILAGAVTYIILSKKKGARCIGCPYADSCCQKKDCCEKK